MIVTFMVAAYFLLHLFIFFRNYQHDENYINFCGFLVEVKIKGILCVC